MPPFIVMDILEKAQQMEAQGENIIHLEIGEPDFSTPEPIKEAAQRALQDGDTHYTHSLGKVELRQEIASYYQRKYGVSISAEQVIVTSGTSPAMLLTFGVLLEKGDEVILPDPHYACYPNFIRYSDGKPVFVPVWEEDGFKYRLADIKSRLNSRTRAIMVNSPATPSGNVFSAAELAALANLGPYIISDEIYHGLVYEGEEHSILEYTDKAFVINGFSKLYAMTGWRLGYVIAPPEFVRPLQKLQQNLFICAGSFIQSAAIAALRECDEHVASMVRTYDKRRRYLLNRLKAMGLATKVAPTGAFYALANIKKYSDDSYAFAFEILEKAKVALTPGIDFGSNCEGYLRISYANSLENIKEGLDRLEAFLAEKRHKT
ncbi:MAG: pyridoxal phosphate-dependent aminotransferase [Clostridia bacterium]|nr:pyridoxal phosphate-dependent aminotransferase [Clostridia bacterium]